MIVVSNTSPVLNLAIIGHLDLLARLYGTVRIPNAVREELTSHRAGWADLPDLDRLPWLTPQPVADRTLITSLALELDPGEAEAIALALECKANLVLLDEHRGRTVAARFGLRYLGLLGVLIEAKRRGLVEVLKPLLDVLVVKAGFWVGAPLYDRVLREVGEN